MQVYRTWSICLRVSVTMTSVCQWRNGKCVYVSVCVCVCVSFQLLSFKLSSGYLFSPHHLDTNKFLIHVSVLQFWIQYLKSVTDGPGVTTRGGVTWHSFCVELHLLFVVGRSFFFWMWMKRECADDDFGTTELKKTRTRRTVSRLNYDAQGSR